MEIEEAQKVLHNAFSKRDGKRLHEALHTLIENDRVNAKSILDTSNPSDEDLRRLNGVCRAFGRMLTIMDAAFKAAN